MIPFLDLGRIHKPLTEEFESVFRDVVGRSAFVNGPEVKAFEEAFSRWVGTRLCVGTASGLDAEVIGLRCLGVKPNDRVIAPAMTFIATIEAITSVGATPLLVDVDQSGLLDIDQAVIAAEASNAKFALPVHLFGQMIDPAGLERLRQAGIQIFEDACQAHGATFDGRAAGTIGDAAAFSFYPGKNLGALGDGGALCTNSERIAEMARALREHGQTKKYYHEYEGYTSRLDNLQAAFLSIKLRHMTDWNKQRIEAARYYTELLQGSRHFRLQNQGDDFRGRHVYHLFVGLTERRESLSEELKKQGIGFGYHYPIPIHQLACYAQADWAKYRFHNSEMFAEQGISLPIFPGIRREEIEQVCKTVRDVCG